MYSMNNGSNCRIGPTRFNLCIERWIYFIAAVIWFINCGCYSAVKQMNVNNRYNYTSRIKSMTKFDKQKWLVSSQGCGILRGD